MTPTNEQTARRVRAHGDAIERAADLLNHYAAFIRDEVKADDLERHPYLPEIEQTIVSLRIDLAALLAASPAVPERWVLVPVEPTEAMFVSAETVNFDNEDERAMACNVWSAMLAAAPTPPVPIPSTPDAPGVDALVSRIWNDTFVSHPYHRGDKWVPEKRALAAVRLALATRPATPDEAAIRADERERCAAICDEEARDWRHSPYSQFAFKDAATAIRAGLSRPVETAGETVAFVQEWMMSSDHEPTQWDRDFAAAIDARCTALRTPTPETKA